MALTTSDTREIETLIRKEIKSFMNNNTIKQFEDHLMDKIQKEIKRGKLEGEVKEITLRMFREFYQFMWTNRSSADLFKNSLDKAFSNISLNSSTLGDHMKYKQGFQEEKLEGGLADKKTVEDIAKKHKMDVQSINKHLKDGMKVELEHTKDKLKAKEIAMDHLFEDPKYYDKLKKIETKESDDLKLSKNDNEMVQGIVDIINQVKDETNKKQIANNMIKQFKKEKIEVDTDEFLKMCKLKVKEKVETKEATGSGSSGA